MTMMNASSSSSSSSTSKFPIPSSLQDLERIPYNLLPYPIDFADDDEAARADSFNDLVDLLETGNNALIGGGISLFINKNNYEGLIVASDGEDNEDWMNEDRMQALYTLVRKSSSLAPTTKSRLIRAICIAVQTLSTILSSSSSNTSNKDDANSNDKITENNEEASENYSQAGTRINRSNNAVVMPQTFRDTLACHLYMLYTIMSFTQAETKAGKSLGTSAAAIATPAKRRTNKGRGSSNNNSSSNNSNNDKDDSQTIRTMCAESMLIAAQAMSSNRSKLWKQGVPDEAVVGLPCRIAYQILENATGVIARKAVCADSALLMIATTIDSGVESLLGTVIAALMDLLHSFDHIAPLIAELCCMTTVEPTNRLSIELLREIGRLDTSIALGSGGDGGGRGDAGGKASGIKNVAPFVSELASVKPRIVLTNISLVLPHLDSEPYNLRSSIVTGIGYILSHIGKEEQQANKSIDENNNNMNISKSRDALLDVLTERVYDNSSFTRAAVLKVWINLTQNGSVPLDRIRTLTALAIDRLNDKTVMVRRSAMQLLTSILENNPFMGCLDPQPYKRKVVELTTFLKSNLPQDLKDAYDTAIAEIEGTPDPEIIKEIEDATIKAAIAEVDSNDNEESSSDLTEEAAEYNSKIQALKFAQSALDFINQFECANQTFQGMLLSSNTSDVTEALRFFVRARHFKLPCAITGIKHGLQLMWSSETAIQDEVLKAFVEIFIAIPGTDGNEPLPNDKIAHNLLVLAGQATVSELASIEEALGRLVKEEEIPAEVFLILWSIALKASGEARAAAMLVLSMGASADPGIVDSASRLRLLLEAGLGDYTEEHRDWRTARSAACALKKVGTADWKDPTSAKCVVLEQIMDRLCVVARGDWCVDNQTNDTKMWFSAAEQAVDALFVICPEPEFACTEIIRGMHCALFGNDSEELSTSCHSLRLSRFFFIVGHIALKLLVYTEALSGAVRRGNAAKSLKKQEIADKAKSQKRTKASDQSSDDEDAIEAELGIAAEMEAENERKVAEISEKEIVGRGLISLAGPLIVRVVGDDSGSFNSQILKQSATLALCKLMCISRSFCEKHLPLLFTALSKAPSQDTTMRANTIIALGDLAFRFPNEFEPYCKHLYACLRDDAAKVRRHTLMVLTHLILNDMVKVKGNVCEIAMCLEDSDARIRDMSRLLFHELSKRSNSPVYNLLPDIISQLSTMSIGKDSFRSIMSFLLGFIKKDRQNEMLIEKLCHRMPKCTLISQKANLAFCISQLKINEKAVKCLSDLFKLYKDALFDEDVKKSFLSIVSKAKKFAKPEMKEALDEWEEKLNEFAEVGAQNELAGKKAERAKAKAAKRATRRKTKQIKNDTEEMHNKENNPFQTEC